MYHASLTRLIPPSVILLSFGLYLSGAFIYVKRIPECWFPGMFDIWVRVIRPHCMC